MVQIYLLLGLNQYQPKKKKPIIKKKTLKTNFRSIKIISVFFLIIVFFFFGWCWFTPSTRYFFKTLRLNVDLKFGRILNQFDQFQTNSRISPNLSEQTKLVLRWTGIGPTQNGPKFDWSHILKQCTCLVRRLGRRDWWTGDHEPWTASCLTSPIKWRSKIEWNRKVRTETKEIIS